MELGNVIPKCTASIVQRLPRMKPYWTAYPSNIRKTKDHLRKTKNQLAEDLQYHFANITWDEWLKAAEQILSDNGFKEEQLRSGDANANNEPDEADGGRVPVFSYRPNENIVFVGPPSRPCSSFSFKEQFSFEEFENSVQDPIPLKDYVEMEMPPGAVGGEQVEGPAPDEEGPPPYVFDPECKELHLKLKEYEGLELEAMHELINEKCEGNMFLNDISIGDYTGFTVSTTPEVSVPNNLVALLENDKLEFPKFFSIIFVSKRK